MNDAPPDQTLQHIHQLQTVEQDMYNQLQTPTLSVSQKEKIIQKINELSSMRLSMYASLQDMYQSYAENVAASSQILQEQQVAVRAVENELNSVKQRLNRQAQERANQVRLIEINTYYGQRYEAHKTLAKTAALWICAPLFVLTLLVRAQWLPMRLFFLGVALVLLVGGWFAVHQWFDILNRDNMVWDNYDWYFNRANAEKQYPQEDSTFSSTTDNDPWSANTTACIGAECCNSSSHFDSERNQCVPNNTSSNNTSSNNNSSNNNSSPN